VAVQNAAAFPVAMSGNTGTGPWHMQLPKIVTYEVSYSVRGRDDDWYHGSPLYSHSYGDEAGDKQSSHNP
jgi:hypothetical protein